MASYPPAKRGVRVTGGRVDMVGFTTLRKPRMHGTAIREPWLRTAITRQFVDPQQQHYNPAK